MCTVCTDVKEIVKTLNLKERASRWRGLHLKKVCTVCTPQVRAIFRCVQSVYSSVYSVYNPNKTKPCRKLVRQGSDVRQEESGT